MKKFSVIRCNSGELSSSLMACLAILTDQGFTHEMIVDVKGAVTLSRGKINPAFGYVLVSPDETILLDYFDLMKWLDEKGLRKL